MNDFADVQRVFTIDNPSFETAYCVKPGFRYSALKPYCSKIAYITDGFETNLSLILDQIQDGLKDFDPDTDCIVPTGTGFMNIATAMYLHGKFPLSSFAVAFFQKSSSRLGVDEPEDYIFYRIYFP